MGVLVILSEHAGAQTPPQPLTLPQSLTFDTLAAACAPDVHPATLRGVVSTESSGNPYAIGVVGGRLERQPRSLAEAVATARELERQGFSFSMGLAQVNRDNLARYGERYETVFEPCRNLRVGSAILKDCFERARAQTGDEQRALGAAFSCYYAGNFTRGFRPDRAGAPSYVQKVVANATDATNATDAALPVPVVPAVKPEGAESAESAESAGAAVAVHPAGLTGRRTGPGKAAATPARWVIFADGAQQGSPLAAPSHAEPGREAAPAVRVQLTTPGGSAAPAGVAPRSEPAPTQRDAEAGPVPRATANSARQDAPFVQFVN